MYFDSWEWDCNNCSYCVYEYMYTFVHTYYVWIYVVIIYMLISSYDVAKHLVCQIKLKWKYITICFEFYLKCFKELFHTNSCQKINEKWKMKTLIIWTFLLVISTNLSLLIVLSQKTIFLSKVKLFLFVVSFFIYLPVYFTYVYHLLTFRNPKLLNANHSIEIVT